MKRSNFRKRNLEGWYRHPNAEVWFYDKIHHIVWSDRVAYYHGNSQRVFFEKLPLPKFLKFSFDTLTLENTTERYSTHISGLHRNTVCKKQLHILQQNLEYIPYKVTIEVEISLSKRAMFKHVLKAIRSFKKHFADDMKADTLETSNTVDLVRIQRLKDGFTHALEQFAVWEQREADFIRDNAELKLDEN